MKLINWLNRKLAIFTLAMSNVEKETLSQSDNNVKNDIGNYQRVNQGRLSDSLKRGEITQEVKDLRWRMYKILDNTDNITAEIIKYDKDGMPVLETYRKTNIIHNAVVDSEDDYDVIMIVDNSEIILSTLDATNIDALIDVESDISKDTDGDDVRTIGEIDFNEYISNCKSERPLLISRDNKPKFNIEDYTKKMVVRNIGDSKRLLELYISIYPDEYNRKSRLFLSEIKKSLKNPRAFDIYDLKTIKYVTENTIGANDFELYEYSIDSINKIIEFDGHYVIKFNANIKVNGINIVNKFRELDLDERYKNKDKK